ncbi:MAG: phosphoribosyl-ATP diphosphatase [Hyphomicrobium sp. 32-62-53]|nr:MAG: phosphoribosyl-ATP diphosphatase [Hyphomicrobium sp. 12-62-95]OYY01161.1 MAG: phosphoribosyl-ATP diphosphatase [Hyphomicrobium sp. 32-62-53]
MSDAILTELAATIQARRNATANASYTKSLLDAGPARCAKKFGEEAVEAVIAATAQDDAALKSEAADVFFHLLVLLESRNIPLADVLAELKDRQGTSGHAEKAARQKP